MLKAALRRRRKVLVLAAVLLAFAAALVAWTRGPNVHPTHVTNPTQLALPTGPPQVPSSAPAKPRKHRAAGKHTVVVGGLDLSLPESALLNAAGAPKHSVVLSATANGRILRMGYLVAGAHPDRGTATLVSSPLRIETVGRGDGLLAAFAVQAAPETTYLDCTVTVDGVVRSHHVTTLPWHFVECLG
jgi:hypothetical protein